MNQTINDYNLKDHLSLDMFLPLSKYILYTAGPDEALLLSALHDAYKTCGTDKEGWFYQTVSTLERFSTLTGYKQRNAIKTLEELELIEQDVRGMPSKRYFRINVRKLDIYIAQLKLYSVTNQLALPDCKEFKDYLLNNKDNIYRSKEITLQGVNDPGVKKFNSRSKEIKHLEVKKLNTSKQVTNKQITNKQIIKEKEKTSSSKNPLIKVNSNPPKEKSHYEKLLEQIHLVVDNDKVVDTIKDYLDMRIKMGLTIKQWKGMLAIIKEFIEKGNEQEAITIIENSTLAGYRMPIFKNSLADYLKQGSKGRSRFDNTSQETYSQPISQKSKQEQAEFKKKLAKDDKGNFLTF